MKRLTEALRDEAKAPHQYQKLMRQLKPQDKKVIKRIILDERKHFAELQRLKRRLRK